MKRSVCTVAVASTLLVTISACGGGEKVGEAFEEFEGGKGGDRIGEVRQTPSPNPGGIKSEPTPTAAPSKTQAPQEQQAIEIKITSSGFNPTSARVYKGASVKVTNTDAKAHSYTASDGTYDTGSVAPGASKTFVADTAGNFQIEDRTRNWIIGSLEVLPR